MTVTSSGAATPLPDGARRRIVMLVDNGVDGDSRVQKQARSAAAEWDVTLLGIARTGPARGWRIGDAEVRLVPFPAPLAKRRHEFRRHWIITPFAYPPTGVAEYRRRQVTAREAALRERRAAKRTGKASLRARSLAVKLTSKWVSFRSWQLTLGRRARGRLTLPGDRLYTAFWRAVKGDRAWRRLDPGLWDYEIAMGRAVDELRPDLIHANDFRMLGVGARAVIRAKAAGRDVKLVWDAHEFLPGVQPWQNNARWLPANTAHEREYVRYADAVVTVSPGLAELLRETHRLPARPTVVLNVPDDPAPGGDVPDIRALCGIDATAPLLVYSGLGHAKRGLGVMVEAMAKLPAVHVALVIDKPAYAAELTARAKKLGVADRLHVLPYVPADQVTAFLAGADVGVIPIRHFPNHEIALITKFFEYSHARLPIVVSDVKTMAATVRETGQGEVFTADDVDDYVRAVNAILADPARYRDAYEKPGLLDGWTWRAQAEILADVYRGLLR
jgi:glycogen(starch) synthase